jgi:hypothetical protein
MVIAVNTLTKRFAGVAAWENAWQGLNKAPVATQAKKAPALDDEFGVVPKAFQVPDPPSISALAVEAAASTARAGLRPLIDRFDNQLHLGLALILDYAVSFHSYLTRGWGHGGHYSLLARVPNL